MRIKLLSAAVMLSAGMFGVVTLTGCDEDSNVTVINFSHTQSPNSLTDLTAMKFKEIVEKNSGGKIEVHIFTT